METNILTQEQQPDEKLMMSLYEMLGVEAKGDVKRPDQGQTTRNILQETSRGMLLIRFNPIIKSKLETGHALFEIKSLCFFAENGIPVPKLLKFNDKFYFKTDKWIICAYFYLPGIPIQRSELSVDLARKISSFLYMVIKVSVNYSTEVPDEDPFINSFNYIIETAKRIEKLLPELKKSEIWKVMKITTVYNQSILTGTPKGIVHADYFYENILKDKNDNIVGLIDFGDAYYGHNLHDIAIGAMECCVLEDEIWNLEIFSAFLQAISPFFTRYSITFQQFYETLKVNCFRFGIYTLPNTLTRESPIKCNIYFNRYEKLMSENFKEEICKMYSEIISSQNIVKSQYQLKI